MKRIAIVTYLSPTAAAFRKRVEDEAAFFETCEGGDPGTPESRSIWLLGIEPGWSLADEAADHRRDTKRDDQLSAYAVELQLEWPFNRNAFKLLSVLEGGTTEGYRDFALRARPFERGSKGYFKGNLFPEPCNNVGEWDEGSVARTGFADKDDYRVWLRENRFRVIKTQIERYRPRLLIGAGLSHLADFLTITGTDKFPSARSITVNSHAKRLHVATDGTVPVAIIPHLSGGPHSLNSDAAIRLAAEEILAELAL